MSSHKTIKVRESVWRRAKELKRLVREHPTWLPPPWLSPGGRLTSSAIYELGLREVARLYGPPQCSGPGVKPARIRS